MAHRLARCLVSLPVTVALAAAPPSWNPPRTPWGDPDLQGNWTYGTMTPLERPKEVGNQTVLSEADAAAYERRTIERQNSNAFITAGPDWWDPANLRLADRRTSLIVTPADGRLPPMTAAAQKATAARADERRRRGNVAAGPEDFALNERCLNWIMAGPPMLPGVYNNNVRVLQTRAYVALLNEMIHDARIIPMDGRAHGTVRQWMGDSRGRWEGTTLVVDTINFTDKTSVRGSDQHMQLTERFTRTDAETLEYRFTIEDPTVWTAPWTAAIPMHKTALSMFEFACHEGNARSVEGMLRSSRLQDRETGR